MHTILFTLPRDLQYLPHGPVFNFYTEKKKLVSIMHLKNFSLFFLPLDINPFLSSSSPGGGIFNGTSYRTFIKNRLVAENNDVELAVCDKAI